MTDLLLDYDPNDTGEIRRIPGEDRTVIIRTDTGEATQRIDPRLIQAPSFDAVPRRTIEVDDTVVYRLPPTVGIVPDLAAAQPIAPLERVAGAEDTAVHTILGSLAGARAGIDGELTNPSGPSTPPPPPPPTGPAKFGRYVGKHRKAVEGTSWWPLAVFVAGAAIAVSGVLLVVW